jgi:hypothetical protein
MKKDAEIEKIAEEKIPSELVKEKKKVGAKNSREHDSSDTVKQEA